LIWLIAVDDVSISAWEPPSSKQLKLEQILSLKTAQERPLLKDFATRYSQTVTNVRDSEILLSRLFESSKDTRFGAGDISTILDNHEQALKSEFAHFSQSLDKILEENLGDSSLEEDVAGIVIASCHADRASRASRMLASTGFYNHEPFAFIG
jgi:hypothetical protein